MTEERPPKYLLNLALFLATILTTTMQGAMYVHPDGAIAPIQDGWVYSVPLLAILVCHELGHYFAARYHGVPASLPYFIPLPFGLLGTMGAVITQEATSDRKKLIDIGAAGPLAGLAVALPVLWYGLRLSHVGPSVGGGSQEGNSLVYALLKWMVTGEWLPHDGRDVLLHPTAWAGWAGLLVTMLNLIPIGQLDGGHVATAYFGNRYSRAAGFLHRCLPVLAVGVFSWIYLLAQKELALPGAAARGLGAWSIAGQAGFFWVMWAAVLLIMKRLAGGEYHPPVTERPLPPSRRALFWVVCVTFLLTFMPVPLRISIGKADVPGRSAPAAAP
jgi:membrane-associated protease RseP (regulator of RpoE activity)